jgi:hypothetical protein
MAYRQQGGLFAPQGQEPQLPEQNPNPSIWDRIGQFYGGGQNPMLSAAENKRAQQEAMTAAGLQMMMMSGRGPQPTPNLLQILAGGAMTGRQAGGMAQQSIMQQRNRAEMAQLMQQEGGADRESLERFLAQLISSGDYEGARALSEYMKSMQTEEYKTVTVGNDVLVIDPRTGELVNQYKGAAKMGAPTGYRTAEGEERYGRFNPETNQMEPVEGVLPLNDMTTQRIYQQSNQLFGRYLSQTADDRKVADLYGTMVAASEDPTAAGDLSMIFAYMKVLDPGSVVREGEFANAQNTGSAPQRVWAAYNRVLRGERLTEPQRRDFLYQATNIARQRAFKLGKVIEHYQGIAERRGLNPEDVAFNYYEIFFPTGGTPAGGGASPGGESIEDTMPGTGGGQ